jgi:peptidoglycan-associated lipoprotein
MKQMLKTILSLALISIIAFGLATTGCKKRARQEPTPPPPPPPPVEQPQVEEPDTTGQAARELQARMEADKARIQTVYFDFDRSDIRPDQRDRIKNDADIFRTWPSWAITVEGHCDERGTNEYNLALGERRAMAAKQALVAEGIDGTRITTISYGEERPVDPGHDESAWAHNRRAEFRVQW